MALKIIWKIKTYNTDDWEISANTQIYVLANSSEISSQDLQEVYADTTLKTFIQRLHKLERK